MTKCSITVINYNTWKLTLRAVKSGMKDCRIYDFEIMIVDNASQEDDFELLRANLPKLGTIKIQLIRSRINTGFGMGNMLGVQRAKGQYYAFLNSKEYPSRKKVLVKPTKVGAVPGSFFICRATDFDKVGGFDTNLFLYYEERDLSFRIENISKKEIYSLPQTSYIHVKRKSTSTTSSIKQELKISQFYGIRKNLGSTKNIIFFLISFLVIMLKTPFKQKNRNHFLLLLQGASLTESLRHKQKIISIIQ